MPNWCENTLTVEGPVRALRAFLGKAKSSEGPVSLQSLLPCPPALHAVGAGFTEMPYEIKYGHWEKYKSYGWVPAEAKASREALWEWFKTSDRGMAPMFKGPLAAAAGRLKCLDAESIAEAYKANLDAHGHVNWYSWCIANWGTKWDVSESRLHSEDLMPDLVQLASGEEEPDGSVEFRFETAWGPPTAAFETVSLDFPELEFTLDYQEPGMGFAGTAKFKNGEHEHEDRDYVDDDEEE